MKHIQLEEQPEYSDNQKIHETDDGMTRLLEPPQEKKSYFWLLVFITSLFTFEGFVLSIFGSTIPLLLAEKGGGYADPGIITFTQLPFALKFLIAPFIDTYYLRLLGKRKTYLSISTLLIGISFLFAAFKIDIYMQERKIWNLFWIGMFQILCTAVYDVALQGWIIKVFPPDYFAKVSSTQLIGVTIGQIFGFYGLIPLSSTTFVSHATKGHLQKHIFRLKDVLLWFGTLVTLVSLIWFVFIREETTADELRLKGDVQKTFLTFKGFIKNKNLRTYIWILFGQSIGFGTIEAVFRYVLVKQGYSKEEFTVVSGYLAPLTIVGTAIATKFTSSHKELTVYLFGKLIRLFKFFFMVWFVYAYTSLQNSTITFVGLNLVFILKNIESSIRRTAIIAFDYRIAEKPISGTYLALLVSMVNLVLVFIDGLYPILLDYIDLGVLVFAGSIYNVVFLYAVWGILMDFQNKASEEFSVLSYIETPKAKSSKTMEMRFGSRTEIEVKE